MEQRIPDGVKSYDGLQLVPEESIKLLLEKLEKDYPHSIQICHWIQVQYMWKKNIPDLEIDILSPRGDWNTDIVIALGRKLELCDQIFATVYAREGTEELLKSLLRETKCIPWNKISRIRGVNRNVAEILKCVISEATGKEPNEFRLHMYYMPTTKAAQLEISNIDGMDIRRLEETHTDDVCVLWSSFSESYRPVMKAVLQYNDSVGVFLGERLVSMVLEAEYGAIGSLETLPEHRRRGYGSCALRYLTRKIGQDGKIPFLHIKENNDVSLYIISKIGYLFAYPTSTILVNYK
ncbi:hypothetical protein B566_EDAN016395 [Ephemera danica]|nr:hypothetical protein B566_EDAN016395 [Ephemera danica]